MRTEPKVSVAGCAGSASTVNVERPLLRVDWLLSGEPVFGAMTPNTIVPEKVWARGAATPTPDRANSPFLAANAALVLVV